MDFKALDYFETSGGSQCVVIEAPHDEPENSWLHYVVKFKGLPEFENKTYKIVGIERIAVIGRERYKKGEKGAFMVKEWPC